MARQNLRPDDSDHPTCRSLRHEPGSAPPLARGLRICSACWEVLEEKLIELPTLAELCDYALDLRPGGLRERVTETRPRSVILCDDVVSVRSEILGVLVAWCGLVTSERRVSEPGELAVRKLVGFLGIHLQWLCQHPVAPYLVDELTELSAAVSAALRPETCFRTAVETCPQPGCGRTVYAEAHRENAEPYEVACEAGHVWAPERWLSLRGKDDGNGNGNEHLNGSSSSHPEKAE